MALPHAVKRSPAYKGCTPLARAVLIELLDQHNGKNNGHLHLARSYMAEQGFRSKAGIDKGRDELLARNLIIKTRQGGLPTRKNGKMSFEGASWFALTWLPISDFSGLDIGPAGYHPGAWSLPVSMPEREQPERLKAAQKKRTMQPTVKARTGPHQRPEKPGSGPQDGPISAISDGLSGPQASHNVITNTHRNANAGRKQHGTAADRAYLAMLQQAGFGDGPHFARCKAALH